MSLEALDAQLDGIRASAASVQKQAAREMAAVREDPNLSDQGKLEAERVIKERHKATLAGYRDSELGAVDAKIGELQRKLDGQVGYGSADIIAFRDAQDRAERIQNGEQAAGIMSRAVRTNDRTLAHAVYRRALENNWPDARKAFTDKYPDAADTGKELAQLEKFRTEGGFQRAMVYGLAGL